MYTHTRPAPQFVDTGVTKASLESYLQLCGYWANDEMCKRYAYDLSPSVYVVSKEQRAQLDRLATTTYQSLLTLAKRMQTIGQQKSASDHEEGRLLRLARLSCKGLHRPSQSQGTIPPIIKVDLVQTIDGKYKIVEVDTYNPRGFGFVALLEESLSQHLREHRLPGLGGVAEIFNAAQPISQPWYMIVSDFERFYEPSFHIFANAMRAYDVEVTVIKAETLASDLGLIEKMTHAVIIPESLYAHPQVHANLLQAHENGLRLLFPPQAYLGSKAFLPYLRAFDGMEEFIPPSVLVGRKCGRVEDTLNLSVPLVLKAAVSSGLKKVYFSDIDDTFNDTLAVAQSQHNPSWVLQEQVPQESQSIVVFDESGERIERDYFLRVTAYIAETGIIDVEVTGRPDRKVHGAPDCIMLPAILEHD